VLKIFQKIGGKKHILMHFEKATPVPSPCLNSLIAGCNVLYVTSPPPTHRQGKEPTGKRHT
jgi:hypothetical protein